MKKNILIIILPLLLVAFSIGCSELQDDLNEPGQINIHKEGIANTDSPNFHAATLRENNWDIESCQECHASDYNGGTVEVSCNGCHSNPGGPEACNTCHGSFADVTRIAPPTDLNNNVSTTSVGVGAHTSHVYENEVSAPVSCYQCHPNQAVAGQSYVASHTDGLPAEISLAGYDNNTNTCSNTYCHGNFTFNADESNNSWGYTSASISGNNFSPLWTKVDNTQAECGTCHGTPPTGHIAADMITCVNCHPSVIDADGNFVNTLLHGDRNIQLVSESILNDPDCDHCHSNATQQPFVGLGNTTDRSSFRVGLHNQHLFNKNLSNNVECASCHIVPVKYDSEGHFDATYGAEVNVFEQSGISLEAFNYETEIYKCNNTYCHGNFEYSKSNSQYPWAYEAETIVGNSLDLTWLVADSEQVACGTCHGLAPTGHVEAEITECANCHVSVIDATGNIIDKDKHMNGVPNVFDN